MAGYSGTPLPKKLGIKEGAKLLFIDAPDTFAAALGPLPDAARVAHSMRGRGPYDVIVVFVTAQRALEQRFAPAVARMKPAAGLWFCWPKKASGVKTDVTEDVIRQRALAAGLVDNKVCAVDETWSGLRVVIRKENR